MKLKDFMAVLSDDTKLQITDMYWHLSSVKDVRSKSVMPERDIAEQEISEVYVRDDTIHITLY